TEADIHTTGSNQQAVDATVTGTLIGAPNNQFGADGGTVSDVTIAGQTGHVITATTITITTAEGNTLVVDRATGNYTYTLLFPIDNDTDANPSTTQGTDIFHYTFTDNDGDTAAANLTVTIIDDLPVATDLSAPGITEADINGTGSNQQTVDATVTGTLIGAPNN